MAISTLARQGEDKLIRQAYLRRQDEIYFYNKELADNARRIKQAKREAEQAKRETEQAKLEVEKEKAENEKLRKKLAELIATIKS